MTDDNKGFQQENHDDFKFDDEQVFFDETSESSEDVSSEANTTRAQKLKRKFRGLGGKFTGKIPSNVTIPSKLKNRRVLIGIVFVILVIIIYMFIGGGSSSSSNSLANGKIRPASSVPSMTHAKVQQISMTGSATKPAAFAVSGLNPTQATQPIAMPVPAQAAQPINISNEFSVKPQPSLVDKPAPVETVSKTQLTSALNELTAKLQSANDKQFQMIVDKISTEYMALKAQSQALANQMTSLQQQITALKAAVSTSHQNIKSLQGKVSDIVNGYTGSFNANGATTYNNVPRPQTAPVVVNKITYVVQAIIPGRAWLYGSNGQTVSVGVGDKIDSYGNVMSIDSLAGTVTMSNGAILKPGA